MHQYGLSGDMDFEAAVGIGQALEATENGDPQETFSVRERRQQNVEARDSAAASFGRALESDEALRAQCKNVESFKRAYTHWRDARVDSGETAALPKCSPAQVLWQLRSMKDELRKQLGVAWLTVVGKAVYVGSRRGSLAGAERQVRESREAAEKDKQGIQVRPLPPQPVFAGVAEPGLLLCSTLRVRNTSEDACKLADVKLLKRSTTGFSATSQPAVLLEPGAELKLQLRFCTQNAGMSSDVLTLRFESCRPGQPSRFNISRYLDIRCGDAAELDELAPTAPYKKRRRQRRPARDETEVVEAPPEPRARGASQPKPVGYKPYNIDAAFRRELETEEAAVRLEDGAERLKLTTRDALPHYKKHMQRLLWAEEHQLFNLVEELATNQLVRSQSHRSLFELKVEGLAENRPSVMKGDRVDVILPHAPTRVYKGEARYIEQENVHIALDASFEQQYSVGEKVEVRFNLRRSALQGFHYGLERTGDLPGASRLIFPEPTDLAPGNLRSPRPLPESLHLFNMVLNEEQTAAVRTIAAGVARHVPYVLFGPPGTGKTTTLVEAVLQCVKTAGLRVLVCASTNTAADVLLGGLVKHLTQLELLRKVAWSRNHEECEPSQLKYTNWDYPSSEFAEVPLPELLKKQVVVATLCTAGKLASLGVPRGHFDVIIVDEAGQAIEPEAIAPAAALLDTDGQLVLGGDPHQLGPVIHSALAKEFGLATSMLDRLMQRPLYRDAPALGALGQRVLTKLVRSYRCHGALLELPNRLFYQGELLPCASDAVANACLGWEGLPTPGVPLLFKGMVGKDMREGHSPSWFNPDEVVEVVKLVHALLQPRAMGRNAQRLEAKHIGVITPYNKQVQRLRKRLEKAHRSDVKVGSTELFQGQERRVIILSTVRSSDDFVGFDRRHNLGFLDNCKRFNTAITRAQALLIVVGNPQVLMLDREHWGALIRLCRESGSYSGVEMPQETHEDDATESLLGDIEQLTLDETHDGPSHAMQQEHMAFRNDE